MARQGKGVEKKPGSSPVFFFSSLFFLLCLLLYVHIRVRKQVEAYSQPGSGQNDRGVFDDSHGLVL
jgi:hypothetical protein